MRIGVLSAAVAMVFVGAAAPAAAEGVQQPDSLNSQIFTVRSKQAPVGGPVRIHGFYTSAQGAQFSCENDFGDGQVGIGPCADDRHTYTQPGTYTITQTGRTTTGVVVVSTGTIVVVPDPGPLSITATTSLSAPLTLVVHSNPVGGYDATRLRVHWGTGSYTSGPATSMQDIDWVYDEPGTYEIKVQVTDSSGATAETTTTAEVF